MVRLLGHRQTKGAATDNTEPNATAPHLDSTEESQPGRPARAWFRAVMLGQYAADDILVEIDIEGKRDLLGNLPTAEAWIPSFHLNDGGDQFGTRSLGPRLASTLRGE